MGDNANWRSPCAILGRRSGRILPGLRRDPIFELLQSHHRQRGPQTRIFKPAVDLRLPAGPGGRDAAGAKKNCDSEVCPSILPIYRAVTRHHGADFAVHVTLRDRRAPVMTRMLVHSQHEKCRITYDLRHSLWYLTGSSDCGLLSRNAIQQHKQWPVYDFDS
jgi:hypothetical protein